MKKEKTLKLAKTLCIGGLILCALIFIISGFDLQYLSDRTKNQISKSYDSNTEITNLLIDTENTKIIFETTQEENIMLAYEQSDNMTYTIEEKDSQLSMTLKDEREWYEKILIMDFSFLDDEQEIIIKLPVDYAGRLDIKTSYASIQIEQFKNLKEASLRSSHGDVIANNLGLEDALAIKTSYSSVTLDDVSSGSLEVHNEHAKVSLNKIISDDFIKVESSYNQIDVNDVQAQGELAIMNEHGHVNMIDVSITGNANIETSYDSIYQERVNVDKDMNLITEHDDIDLVDVNVLGSMILDTSYGDSILNQVKVGANASIYNEHGAIQMNQVEVFDKLYAETNYNPISFEDLSATSFYFDVIHGGIYGVLDGSMNDYIITSQIEHGDNSLPQKKLDGTKELFASASYDDIEIEFANTK